MSNVTVLQRFSDGGLKVRVQGAADPVELSLSPSPGGKLRVSWASDWLAVSDLKRDGLLSKVYDRHCWGDIQYYATPKLLEEVKQGA